MRRPSLCSIRRQIEIDTCDRITDPAHLSEFGQRDDDGRAVLPQHSPEVLGRQRQRCLGRYVRLAKSIALHHADQHSVQLATLKYSSCN